MTELAPGIVVDDGGAILVDPAIVYPEILKALGVAEGDYDQYWLETAYQCAKLEVQRLVAGTKHDPRPKGVLRILISSRKGQDDNRSWALVDYPEGRGAYAATKGLEAKEHYRRWRGVMPA